MSPGVPFSDDLSRIRYELELFQLGGPFALYEDGRPLGNVEQGCSETGFAYGKLVLSCWGDGWSRSWRVVACQPAPDRLLLKCVKKIGLVNSLLELRRGETGQQQSREEFSKRLPSLIESGIPGLRVERTFSARDDRLHLSATHTRLAIRDRGRVVAAVGAGTGETQASIDQLLGAGLIWLDALR
ncbi:MAG TPA: hypothetical protein VLD57_08460, partial [Blastocatellia bacterium]|nr:hypothetical protein [Blastocatellia bacterium]